MELIIIEKHYKQKILHRKMIKRERKGQVTIFVIVAIVIISVIIVAFLFNNDGKISSRGEVENVKQFIDNCVKKEANDLIDFILPTGGLLDNKDSVLYKEQRIPYLCKNINYYEPCINQHSRFILKVQEGFNDEIKKKVEQCFSLLEDELENKNYNVNGGEIFVNSKLKPELIEIEIKRDFDISKGDLSQGFDLYSIFINSPIYDLAYVANEITAQEAKYCYFNIEGYMTLYNKFDIRKDVLSDSTKIYNIKDKQSGKEMKIAIRGCAIPYGI